MLNFIRHLISWFIIYACSQSELDNQSPQLTSQPAKTELTGIIMLTAESTWTAEKHNFTTIQSKPEWHVNMKNQYQTHYVLYIYMLTRLNDE